MKSDMNDDHTLISFHTWKKNIVISHFVQSLRVKDKRVLFNIMRSDPELGSYTFFPLYGLTAAEFSTWQILSDKRSRK